MSGVCFSVVVPVYNGERWCVGAACRLALCPRQGFTLKLYKLFFGVSYDAAILDARRERLSVSQR